MASPDSEQKVTTNGVSVKLSTVDNKVNADTATAVAEQDVTIFRNMTNIAEAIIPGDVTFHLSTEAMTYFPDAELMAAIEQPLLTLGYGVEQPQSEVSIDGIPASRLPVNLAETVFDVWVHAYNDSSWLMASAMRNGTFYGNLDTAFQSTMDIMTGKCSIFFDQPVEFDTPIVINMRGLGSPYRQGDEFTLPGVTFAGEQHYRGTISLHNSAVVPGSIRIKARSADNHEMLVTDNEAGALIGDTKAGYAGTVDYSKGYVDFWFANPVMNKTPVIVAAARYQKVKPFMKRGGTTQLNITIPFNDLLQVVANGNMAIASARRAISYR